MAEFTSVSSAYRFWLLIRSSLFWIVFLPSVLICVTALAIMIKTPVAWRVKIIKLWIKANLGWLRWACNLDYQVEGLDNVPDQGFIVLSKHSSTWETIALQLFFPPLVWVVKRELTWIPFFGWGLKAMNVISINRGIGRQAIRQLIEEGRQRMDEGRIVIMFPEGTRVLPGEHKPFKIGGAILAEKTAYPVVPVAHNAGEFWPRHSWIKWPGTIKVVIGEPIVTQGKKTEAIMREVEDWINATVSRISDHKQLHRLGVESDAPATE